MADYALYRGADLPGNPGNPVTSWPSALPGGPALTRSTGSGTVQVDAAGLRFLRLATPGQYQTAIGISVPGDQRILAHAVVAPTALFVWSRDRFSTTTVPAEYHCTHVPSAAIYPSATSWLQFERRTPSTLRLPAGRILISQLRGGIPYTRAGQHSLFVNGMAIPMQWTNETALGPTTFAKPLMVWWDQAATTDLYHFQLTDAPLTATARHQVMGGLCTTYQTPYRGTTPLCFDATLIDLGTGGGTALTVTPTAAWQAGRLAVAIVSFGSQQPASEVVTPPPGWSRIAVDRPDPQPPAGWGHKEIWVRTLTGTEGPQTWRWVTTAWAAVLVLVWGTEFGTTPQVFARITRIGSYDSTATGITLSAQAPLDYAAVVWVTSWWLGYYSTPYPTDDVGGTLRPGIYNFLNTGTHFSGLGTARTYTTTWSWSPGVRGHGIVLVLTDPVVSSSGFRASRMGILAAPRLRRRPGPG
jgi:hypothetical protein